MNVQTLFQNFNPGKFIIHCSLMLFTIFFSLRLDGTIQWSYWAVFSPIWFWKFMVIFGAAVGSFVWWRYPHFRLEGEAYIHYKAMLITLALHLILLMFELLACDKLQSGSDKFQSSADKIQAGRHLWILVFIPLIFISVVSIAVCIWAVKHDRSFELELFCSVNMLQFIFLALRLDGFTQWSWEVVFVPLWIVMCLSLVSVLYTIIFAGILIKTPEVNSRQRRTSFNAALGYTLLVVPILVFQVLLTNKLDEDISMSFFCVSSPLLISFTTLIIMSFNSKGGNKWWFGLRKDFCQFLLGICPFLQEYANIAYNSQINLEDSRTNNSQPVDTRDDPSLQNVERSGNSKVKCKSSKNVQISDSVMKSVAPIISIDMPD